ncbi:hypothetical protein WQ54_15760 [Bacillus sp. SA1-12]|uniref:helix-turn-helix domain-containing protein n=1 Tax=Bacillus sp. SA1-12 TaxID=1455638 RepID=UPI000626FE3A|nr:helix-turn-helix transcriptional regulator [Bacillus sp. SA1-12]KKI91277.1 hypothetical protein WQ54_15760 [Bacillus sp. SA1-12]
MHSGERLKAIRIARGFTQADVSKMIDVDKNIISRAERSSNVGSILLRKLCMAYNVSSSFILELEDNQFDLETKWAILIKLCKRNNISPNEAWRIVKSHVNEIENK